MGLPRGTEHILVVEDDELVRSHLVTQLAALGYTVTQAENGQVALRLLDRLDRIDLLFTDVVMPGGLNGKDLAHAARARRPGLKVLFTSGYAENALVQSGRVAGNATLLQKPYRRNEMAAAVRRALDDAPSA